MADEQNILSALRKFGRIKSSGGEVIMVKRTDHPHASGDWYYAVSPAEKTLWTVGERVLSPDEIADLWYAADCPPWR